MCSAAIVAQTKLDSALAYAERGIPVLPVWWLNRSPSGALSCACGTPGCTSPGKHPIPRLVPSGFKDATTAAAVIHKWWAQHPSANIGLRMGEVSGLIAIDVDGPAGYVSVKGKAFPPGPVSKTGKGEHRFYKWPGFRVPPKVRLLPGLDVRGDDSYIVAPPSSHVLGKIYTWQDGLSLFDIDPPPVPDWLLNLLQRATKPADRSPEEPESPILEGERNAALTSLAGTMRRRNMTAGAIEAALLKENVERCKPPLAETEVKAIATSIARYEPAEEADPFAQQRDYGHALVLSKPFAGRYRWASHRGSWMQYEEGAWRPMAEEQMGTVASDTLRRHYAAELAVAKDKNTINALTDKIKETCTFARISGALSFLKGWDGVFTSPEEWDKDAWALNVGNGTLDLRTGTLRPHNPEDLLTKKAPIDYKPDALGTAWEDHLEMFQPNRSIRRQVQRSLGVGLVGTDLEEALDIWHGRGSNGKTTTARVLMDVFGDYALRAAPDLLIASKHERHPTEIADLCGSRLVFSVEVDEGKQLAEALVKDLTGGDTKKARFMRQDFFHFKQTFSITLTTNHEPIITGTDDAIWRRIRLIPWNFKIDDYPDRRRPQEEVVPELVAEGNTILNWALAGLKDWQQDHWWKAPEVEAATQEYRGRQDQLGSFLADSCELGPRFSVGVAALYEQYAQWCEEAGEDAVGKRVVGSLLRQRGISQRRVGPERTSKWVGIRFHQVEG